MLRINSSRRSCDHYATFAVVALLGIAVSALPGPGDKVATAALVEEPAAQTDAVSQFNFSYVPADIFGLVAIRPAELAADERLQPLAKLLEQGRRPGLPSELVEQATIILVAPDVDEEGRRETGSGGEQSVVHTIQPVDFEEHLKNVYASLTTEEHDGRELLVTSPSPYTMSYFAPDETTLIGRGRTGLLKLLSDGDASQKPAEAELWQEEVKGPVLMVINQPAFRMLLGRPIQPGAAENAAMVLPIVRGVETILLSIDVNEQITLHGRLVCKSAEDTERVVEALDGLAESARNNIDAQQARPPERAIAAREFMAFMDFAQKCLEGKQVTADGSDVRLKISLGETDDVVNLFTELLPAIQAARTAARITASLNDVKQLSLAMLNYESNYGKFPPAASTTYRKDGEERSSEHPHSWRVALLPFLDAQALYDQYHFDEPWDSEANMKVVEQMPNVFRSPHDEARSTNTSYFVFTGPETIFHDEEGTRLSRITDGLSRTLLLVEAKRPVPWTKPEDIPYAADQPVPKLGGWLPGEFVAARADGSVVLISTDVEESALRPWITMAGGEENPELPKPDGSN